MFIKLTPEGREQNEEICLALDIDDLLAQLMDGCRDLIIAAQTVRRALRNTTPFSVEEAKRMLDGEAGDVLLTLDCLEKKGVVRQEMVQLNARHKNRIWYGRVIGNGR